MPLQFVKGDMFDYPADARVNTVNCVGAMGKGIALSFKVRYPGLYKDYRMACRKGVIFPGKVWVWSVPSLTVFNVATKDDWRAPSQYAWVAKGLLNLRKALDASDCASLTLPPLGCGNGGLEWPLVGKLVMKSLGDSPVKILVVTGP